MSRSYDLIIYGATGYTGKLAVEYMAATYDNSTNIKWAFAGRSESKLEKIKQSILSSTLKNIEYFVVDANDDEGLASMVQQTKAVATFAGPYAIYGSKLVKYCVEYGTHYADLAGEPPWIKSMMNQYHEKAISNQCRIVTTCGFDSVPSDMAVFCIAKYIEDNINSNCITAKGAFVDIYGGISGGTIASGMNSYNNWSEESLLSEREPQYFVPNTARNNLDSQDQSSAQWDEEFKSWTSPFAMNPLNMRVVRRSNYLLKYDSDFTYSESQFNRNIISAFIFSWINCILMSFIKYSFLQPIAKMCLPAPGSGPSQRMIDHGFFHFKCYGFPKDRSCTVFCDVHGRKDPGYYLTARMLCEAAISLSVDDVHGPFGFVTPATLGAPYVERLKSIGMTFNISVVRK